MIYDLVMAGKAREIKLTEEERERPESWARKDTKEIPTGRDLGLRPATANKWRIRFS